MKSKEKNKNGKIKEKSSKENEDNNRKEKIKNLVNKMKNNKFYKEDDANSILNCYIQQDFRPLSINELVSIISDIKKFEDDAQKINVRHSVMNTLKNEIPHLLNYFFLFILLYLTTALYIFKIY